jgi:2-(3-amino-3-carboxypropyl)histidine synthase
MSIEAGEAETKSQDGETSIRKRRVIKRRTNRVNANVIPDSISQNKALLSAISTSLPSDYDFEILKTIWRIETSKATHVALQMPEGLLMYACTIADILRKFSVAKTLSVLGDVTYGACCIDDLGAKALGCDLLVHYGHSCLVPLTTTAIPCLYVFVEIRIDVDHLVESFCKTCDVGTRVHVMGTVQFRSAIAAAAKALNERDRPATIPQAKPLSPGEVLGCTAPGDLGKSIDSDGITESKTQHVMLFIADGRFHLEAAMIANPTLRALRYDPYSKTLTDERYETEKMKSIRHDALYKAIDPSAKMFGVILGTLGRQGNPAILGHVRSILKKHGKKSFVLLLSEIFPKKLEMFKHVDVWVQIACPRLSVDWGHFFQKPVLSPYELNVALGEEEWRDVYPMDFYKAGSGRWSNYHQDNRNRCITNECQS